MATIQKLPLAAVLLLSLTMLLPTHSTESTIQAVPPSTLLPGRVQIQFPDIGLLADTAYISPLPDTPFLIYTPADLFSIRMNVTFFTTYSKTQLVDPVLLLLMIDSSTNMTLDTKQIHVADYTNGTYETDFTSLPPSETFYFAIRHMFYSFPEYRIELTKNETRITASPVFLAGVTVRQLTQVWDLNAPTEVSAPKNFVTHGVHFDSNFFIFLVTGAFTFELEMELRRLTDGKLMNNELTLQGITHYQAHWERFPTNQPIIYFPLSINSSSSPTLRLPRPPDRYAINYRLIIDGLPGVGSNANNYATLQFFAGRRVRAWQMEMELGGSDTRLLGNYDSLTEYEYATQEMVSYITISRHQSYLLCNASQTGSVGNIVLWWYSASTSGTGDPGLSTVRVSLPLQDEVIRLRLMTQIGQNVTWFFTREMNTSVSQTQDVLQTYQHYESDLIQASKNLSQTTNRTNDDQFQVVSVSGTSVIGLQRFTPDHTVTATIPVSQFLSKSINITVTPTTSGIQPDQRDIHLIILTPNPIVWATSEPIIIGNISQASELELIPDSSAVSLTLTDINGVSLTPSPLNQGTLTHLSSYSYSITQSYDITDSCPIALSCAPKCRLYDPATQQWISNDIVTEITSNGIVRCSSSTPGTIALLRAKIITRTDVEPNASGQLTYSHAKNDAALAIALIVVAGVFSLLMFIGGFVSFLYETQSIQAQINELKRSMMEDESLRIGNEESIEETNAQLWNLPSTPSDQQQHQDESSSQVKLLIDPWYSRVETGIASSSAPSSSFSLSLLPPSPRISQLAPEFRPLSEETLARQYSGATIQYSPGYNYA